MIMYENLEQERNIQVEKLLRLEAEVQQKNQKKIAVVGKDLKLEKALDKRGMLGDIEEAKTLIILPDEKDFTRWQRTKGQTGMRKDRCKDIVAKVTKAAEEKKKIYIMAAASSEFWLVQEVKKMIEKLNFQNEDIECEMIKVGRDKVGVRKRRLMTNHNEINNKASAEEAHDDKENLILKCKRERARRGVSCWWEAVLEREMREKRMREREGRVGDWRFVCRGRGRGWRESWR